jgi:hypothetical protein
VDKAVNPEFKKRKSQILQIYERSNTIRDPGLKPEPSSGENTYRTLGPGSETERRMSSEDPEAFGAVADNAALE